MAGTKSILTKDEIEKLRQDVAAQIQPLQSAKGNFSVYSSGRRTRAGEALPAPYYIYFLLIQLLRFRDLGREEKVDWSIPVDVEGELAFIEHRKFGVGVFTVHKKDRLTEPTEDEEKVAARIVKIIKKGIEAAQPFFNHLAAEALSRSALNVTNDSTWLFERYEFARDLFFKKRKEAEANRDKRITKEVKDGKGKLLYITTKFPSFRLRAQARWLGISAIEAFFSWTEHVFIHLAIIQAKAITGDEVEALARANWQVKAKAALDLTRPEIKQLYDDLLVIRNHIRNFRAHGSFGKSGEAFHFHSRAGAVPLVLTEDLPKIAGGQYLDEFRAVEVAEQFIKEMWSGPLSPAKIYIQDSELPLILTMALDGTYSSVMSSEEDMENFVKALIREMDDAANMDW